MMGRRSRPAAREASVEGARQAAGDRQAGRARAFAPPPASGQARPTPRRLPLRLPARQRPPRARSAAPAPQAPAPAQPPVAKPVAPPVQDGPSACCGEARARTKPCAGTAARAGGWQRRLQRSRAATPVRRHAARDGVSGACSEARTGNGGRGTQGAEPMEAKPAPRRLAARRRPSRWCRSSRLRHPRAAEPRFNDVMTAVLYRDRDDRVATAVARPLARQARFQRAHAADDRRRAPATRRSCSCCSNAAPIPICRRRAGPPRSTSPWSAATPPPRSCCSAAPRARRGQAEGAEAPVSRIPGGNC